MGGHWLTTTTLPGGRPTGGRGQVRVQQLVLVASPQGDTPAVTALTGASMSIGRNPRDEGRLCVPDPEVSRTHATLARAPEGQWVLSDGGSRNGTLVNGVRVDRAELADGAVIRVGQSLLVFVDVILPLNAPLDPDVGELRGASLRMQVLRGEIALVAERPVPVLILGETGVGKERVAHELHARSRRSGRLVPVNCAALPESLAESELFGHAAGAFTGATGKNAGVFVAAEGGTLFLDEVGELPASVQAKLLRALATGEVRPVGQSEARTVDVRIVAATLRDVAAAVGTKDFRADLFSRLSAWTLRVPPLRARRDDLLALSQALLAAKGASVPFSPDAAEALLLFDWPYNVRQLEQIAYVATVRAGSAGVVQLEHLPEDVAAAVRRREPLAVSAAAPPVEAIVSRTATPTAEQLTLIVKKFGGNVARVAEYFGKNRRQVYRWAERYGIDPESFRDEG